MSRPMDIEVMDMDIEDYEETCCTNSRIVLGYINNEVKRISLWLTGSTE